MSRDKQILEMAEIMCNCYDGGDCKMHGKLCDLKCISGFNALGLYNAGYRKSSDVAREIFEEIDNILRLDAGDYDDLMDSETVPEIYTEYLACSNYIDGIRRQFAELKKKYTEERK